jgi:hypothetical protein
VRMMRFLAILALVQAVLAQSGGLMSIYLNPGQNKPATVTLGAGARKMRFSAQGGVLELASANQSVFTMEPTVIGDGQFADEVIGMVDVKGGMSVTSIFSDDYEILSPENQLQKWLIAGSADDPFVDEALGNAGYVSTLGGNLTIQKCAGLWMLGGPNKLASAEISKTYYLPKHSEVKVTARYSFVDNWDDDTGYMKIDNQVVWTEEYTWCPQFFTFVCPKGHNACGSEFYPDKLSRLISVVVPHSADTITLAFGSTIPGELSPTEVSYGISGVSIEVR